MSRKFLITLLFVMLGVCIFLMIRGKDPEDVGAENKAQKGESSGDYVDSQGSDLSKEARSKKRTSQAKPRPTSVTTGSGLIYQVLREGDGVQPGPTDRVQVAYRGWVRNGEEFDKSPEGRPIEFPLNQVIKGWQEGVQLMKVGAKYRFTIPPELAYGERGAGEKIPPNAILVFDVELIEVK